jgi:DNA transposition AAA+ family ATPase
VTKNQSIVSGPVAIKNVAAFMVLTQRAITRDPHLPGIVVCSGFSGVGKTYASIYAQNKTRALRVEVGDSWTRRTVMTALLRELGVAVKGRASVSDMMDMAVNSLGDDPSRPLIVDEADKLVDKGMIELIRELHEHSGAPIVLIGEERLPQKLLSVERVHNRVLDWMQAQPCDIEDAAALAKAFAPGVTIEPDLLDMIRAMSDGRARRIVVNVARVAELSKNTGKTTIGKAQWGSEKFYTSEPPPARSVENFKRARAA